ncbi:hypothetical protein FQR65_LT20397 [Abscondita terminalis]|nr:hypothetical protein FQR65_LT20397 [Abscondita terminalis]
MHAKRNSDKPDHILEAIQSQPRLPHTQVAMVLKSPAMPSHMCTSRRRSRAIRTKTSLQSALGKVAITFKPPICKVNTNQAATFRSTKSANPTTGDAHKAMKFTMKICNETIPSSRPGMFQNASKSSATRCISLHTSSGCRIQVLGANGPTIQLRPLLWAPGSLKPQQEVAKALKPQSTSERAAENLHACVQNPGRSTNQPKPMGITPNFFTASQIDSMFEFIEPYRRDADCDTPSSLRPCITLTARSRASR